MAIVVDDWLRCSILMVKVSRLRYLKQEIVVDEVHGSFRAANGQGFDSAKGFECMCSLTCDAGSRGRDEFIEFRSGCHGGIPRRGGSVGTVCGTVVHSYLRIVF